MLPGTFPRISRIGMLQAVQISSGEAVWEFRTEDPVKGSVAIDAEDLFFPSGNKLFKLNKETGLEIWRTQMDFTPNGQFDYWDYHHSTPLLENHQIYYGAGNGVMYIIDRENGQILYSFATTDSAAIRCTPVLSKNVLYFGDWNGRVYAWNTRNGNIVWNHIELDGGWISGDPFISGDTLYIGSSDSHKMFAFDLYSGKLHWTYGFLNNNFAAPVLWNKYLLFTTADAYSVFGTSPGAGYLYALDRMSGTLVNFSRIGSNCLSTPVVSDNVLYAGPDDGKIYSLDLDRFAGPGADPDRKGYKGVDSLLANPNPFSDSTVISYKVLREGLIQARITDLNGSPVFTMERDQQPGIHSFKWPQSGSGKDSLQNAYFRIFLKMGEYEISSFLRRNGSD